jgi:hypothetical protein
MSIGKLLAALFLSATLAAPTLSAQPLPDYLTGPIEWQTADGAPQRPIHVSLLPDGRLYFFEPAFAMTPTPYWIWRDEDLPDTVTVSPTPPPLVNHIPGVQYGQWHVADVISCAGHTFAEDGSLVVVGGTRLVSDGPPPWEDLTVVEPAGLEDFAAIFGFSDSLAFNPATDSWSTLPNMIGPGQASFTGPGARWYPTATRLADGRIMVTSGLEMVMPAQIQNRSVEVFDPTTASWEVLSQHEETPPAVYNRDYSHVFQLPESVAGTFDVLMMGEAGQPVLMSTEGLQRWQVSARLRPGSEGLQMPNHGTTTALLPIRLDGGQGYSNGAIMMLGGQHMSTLEHSIDIYDPVVDQWLTSIDMGIRRHHASTILLPDSRVLIMAGHNDFGANPGYAQYLNPRDGFSLTPGSVEMPETRGYHTISALLPDGRIFLGGGNDGGQPGSEKPNFRYYYPDYMLKPRPNLLQAQPTFKLGDYFWLLTGDKTPISEIVLVALGSMTHSYDMNQRVVELPIVYSGDYGEHSLQISRAPLDAKTAPPGHYMLFVLDEARVPSVAKIVNLTR